jgi:hypothetical protein
MTASKDKNTGLWNRRFKLSIYNYFFERLALFLRRKHLYIIHESRLVLVHLTCFLNLAKSARVLHSTACTAGGGGSCCCLDTFNQKVGNIRVGARAGI